MLTDPGSERESQKKVHFYEKWTFSGKVG